ncbi:MAG TPA: YebC/PmpR family DNA-binding transcriptional regulator [Patescibacteria group bacterium]|nr:YebC/PmpR family DNA-binding transcriptional regulator [Patescibacteria group bacterium]
MSGHSKWNNIKNKKAVEDSKRSKVFTKIAKDIRTAVRVSGNADPNSNSSLRVAMEKAREANMSNDHIKRAIDRGLGKGTAGSLEEVNYEAYAHGGVGFLIITRTDNHQRTGAEIRNIVETDGGSLGGPGSAMFLFTRVGGEYQVTIPFEVSDQKQWDAVQNLVDELEAHDDVEAVYINAIKVG